MVQTSGSAFDFHFAEFPWDLGEQFLGESFAAGDELDTSLGVSFHYHFPSLLHLFHLKRVST